VRRISSGSLTLIVSSRIPHESSSAAALVTVSLGVASVAVQPSQTAPDLIKAADDALYRAKREGRNRVVA
jgi:diguanylate cyclase (GGDEF)-like protein